MLQNAYSFVLSCQFVSSVKNQIEA